MKVLYFLIICIALYGPKIGLIDLSLFAGILATPLVLAKPIKICRQYYVLLWLLGIIVAYSAIVFLASGATEYVLLRSTRSFLAAGLLGVIFCNLDLKLSSQLDLIVYALILNALVIFVQVVSVNAAQYFASIYEFNKTIVPLRAFGLTAGYDTAGYLCVTGLILCYVIIFYKGMHLRYIIAIVILTSGVMFTSRSSMILAFSIITSASCIYLVKGSLGSRIFSFVFLMLSLAAISYYLYPLIINTFDAGLFSSDANKKRYLLSFAETDIAAWQQDMWMLPQESIHLLFGGLADPPSDVGYVKLIFMMGILGLSLVIAAYIYFLIVLVRIRKQISLMQSDEGQLHLNIAVVSLLVIQLMQFIFNIKNLYFLSRGHFELLLIMFLMVSSHFGKVSRVKSRSVTLEAATSSGVL